MIFDWLDAHNVNAGAIITVMPIVALFSMIAAPADHPARTHVDDRRTGKPWAWATVRCKRCS
ncbi:MAG: hypothetical protein ACLTZY_05180 [Alistipes indistinctus]